jgi:hypothetical protein
MVVISVFSLETAQRSSARATPNQLAMRLLANLETGRRQLTHQFASAAIRELGILGLSDPWGARCSEKAWDEYMDSSHGIPA